jgi:hypothetical protein
MDCLSRGCSACRHDQTRCPSYSAPQLGHAPTRSRRRPAHHSGLTGTRQAGTYHRVPAPFAEASDCGGHLDRCSRCGHEAISYCSCRNRHCPKCQTNARDKWLAKRSEELLPVSYVHVVFTLPHELSWLALHNKKVVYDLLFRSTAATLLEIAADPKHLGAEIGFLSVPRLAVCRPITSTGSIRAMLSSCL